MSTLITNTVQGVQNIKYDASTTAMTIDNSGNTTVSQNLTVSGSQILTPARPSFYVYNLTFSADGSSEEATGGTIDHNIGSHYNSSNGRFTAPVSGVYQFMAMAQGFNSGSTSYVAITFRKNGSNYGAQSALGYYNQTYNNHGQANITALFNLNANDYIQLHAFYSARDAIQSDFGGFLVG